MRGALACWRYWLPIMSGVGLVIGTSFAGPILTWIMIIVAFGLILDGATAMWERAGGTGGMSTYKQ